MALQAQIGNTRTSLEGQEDRSERRCLLDLPDELLMDILKMSLSNDILSAMKTCHRLHGLALEPLYRDICLNLNATSLRRIRAMANPLNMGLKEIRTLSFNNRSIRYPNSNYYEFWPTKANESPDLLVQVLLRALPEHSLQKFGWDCNVWDRNARFNGTNFEILLQTQNDLQELEALQLTVYTDQLRQSLKDCNLHSVHKLTLNTCFGPTNLRWGNLLLRKARNIRHLTVKATVPQPLDGGIGSQPTFGVFSSTNTSEYAHLVLFKHFFETGPKKSLRPPPIGLTHLHLCGITFRESQNVYGRVVELSVLKCVHLDHCINVTVFMDELRVARDQLQSLTALVVRHGEDRAQAIMFALEELLRAIEGLETLIIDFSRVSALPDVGCIGRHWKTLRNLAIHGYLLNRRPSCSQERVYPEDDLRTLSDQCPDLERLSIGLRPAVAGRDKQSSFWNHMLPLLCKMPRLHLLHITPGPFRNESAAAGVVVDLPTYHQRVRDLAEGVFKENMAHSSNTPMCTVWFGRDNMNRSLRARCEVPGSLVFMKHSGRSWIDEDSHILRYELHMSSVDIEDLRAADTDDEFLSF